MENASKALIIAGAILVSILIISLGVMIFSKAQPDDRGWDQQKISAYNADFEKYEGTAVRGTTVRQLVKDTYLHNVSNKDDTSLQVQVKLGDKVLVSTGTTVGNSGIKKDNESEIKNGKTYQVKCNYDEAGGGLVTSIDITLNGTSTTTPSTP